MANIGRTYSEETKTIWCKQRKGDKNPNWRGGIHQLPYSFDFTNELKEVVKKRDGYTCQFPRCSVDIDLTVHHIDYDKQNSNTLNLITLCRTHNSKVNTNREYWDTYFKGGMV